MNEELIRSKKEQIRKLDMQIANLKQQRANLQKEILNLEIEPFRIGGYCMAEVKIGRSKKNRKCLIEADDGFLYLRPIKKDGELSEQRFLCFRPDTLMPCPED